MLRRRLFCQALAGTGASVSRVVAAQTPTKVYRIGELTFGRPAHLPSLPPDSEPDPFVTELARLGLIEGVNLVTDHRSAHGNPALMDTAAAELVAARPDLLFSASGVLGARALKRASTTIPIVFAAVGEPVAAGLVASLTRPGGNLTGGTVPAELELKRIQILIEVLGTAASVVQLTTPISEQRKASTLAALAQTRTATGVRLQFLEVGKSEDLVPAFEEMTRQRVSGVAIAKSFLTASHAPEIAALAVKYRLPAIGDGIEYTDLGLMMSYSFDMDEILRKAANYVYKILKGARPADLPIEQVTKFDFIVNLKAAKSLGVRIPSSVLIMASRVID